MMERDMLLCNVIASLGHVRGRKRFQKLMYVAKALGYPVPESFVWGNYGVYSSELQWELDSLAKDGVIVERNIAASGQEPEYDYTLGPPGARLLDQARMLAAMGETLEARLSERDDPVSAIGNNEMDALIAFLLELNAKSVRELELWSSILYLRGSEQSEENLIAFLRYLKPQYSDAEIRQGIGEVAQLANSSFEAVRRSRVR